MLDHENANKIHQLFCETPAEPTSEDAITSAESQLGTVFPVDYREYLLAYNGGKFSDMGINIPGDRCANYDVEFLYSLGDAPRYRNLLHQCESFGHSYSDFNYPNTDSLFPIAGMSDGSWVCLERSRSRTANAVYFGELFEEPYKICDSFNELLTLLVPWDSIGA